MKFWVSISIDKLTRSCMIRIICPDNDVSEDTDRRRMMWTAGDAVCGRPPLSRWREEFKDQAVKEMAEMKL